ncbi:unnamed protein product [Leptidea sinapis]|uniref:Headcase middle domain-containing protein n=1 Tax=Leptidea sinapis TaxID=189913 RepID=A0A5E4QWU3_9NEOP|nr:unnamed protein product [Leptidea sinapis]
MTQGCSSCRHWPDNTSRECHVLYARRPCTSSTGILWWMAPSFSVHVNTQAVLLSRTQFLTCVCMGCLERSEPERTIRCRFCGQKWDGSSLVLGTMYSYDIFMATPCCSDRLKCNSCYKTLLHPHQRLNYSDYSHPVTCPHCRVHDTHFVKPLTYCFTKRVYPLFQQWP